MIDNALLRAKQEHDNIIENLRVVIYDKISIGDMDL